MLTSIRSKIADLEKQLDALNTLEHKITQKIEAAAEWIAEEQIPVMVKDEAVKIMRKEMIHAYVLENDLSQEELSLADHELYELLLDELREWV